jgi:SAM-dependent methyltransferase
MHALDRRAEARELLDGDALEPRDLRENLREMAMLNRLPGGTATSIAAIRHLAPGDAPTIIDVGTGGADLPRRIRRELPRATVLGVDVHDAVLEVARSWTRTDAALELQWGDARALPLPDASVDVAHASLVLHHLAPRDATQVLREMRRVARGGVVINDLRRGTAAYGLTALLVLGLARNPVTRHDGLLSARRAYTLPELDAMAADAGLRPVWRSPAFLPRVVTAYR